MNLGEEKQKRVPSGVSLSLSLSDLGMALLSSCPLRVSELSYNNLFRFPPNQTNNTHSSHKHGLIISFIRQPAL